jgi:outer membrane protein OmpA-like peptidoglycan-associated protein
MISDQWGAPRNQREEAEESYFVSMTDVMVGLLFIFIIMLMAFALMLKDEQAETEETRTDVIESVRAVQEEVSRLRGLENERTQMLRDIKARLAERGIQVILREGSGVLQLPDELLFASNERRLDAEGLAAVDQLAEVLDTVLPCYTRVPEGLRSRASCPNDVPSKLRLEAIFVEGHTDREGSQAYNWDLSADRAINTFRALAEEAAIATELRNDDGKYLFSVAGYGENRPAVEGATEAAMRQNRRIDLRFVMNLNYRDALEDIEQRLQSIHQMQ